MLTLHNLKTQSKKKAKRLGRGNAKGGNYSGRGMKGQKARSGASGFTQKGIKSWLMKVPKTRGFRSPQAAKENVTLEQLERNFKSGDSVTPFVLQQKGLIKDYRRGVKILANGKLTKSLEIKVHGASAAARDAITKANGKLELMVTTRKAKSAAKK